MIKRIVEGLNNGNLVDSIHSSFNRLVNNLSNYLIKELYLILKKNKNKSSNVEGFIDGIDNRLI